MYCDKPLEKWFTLYIRHFSSLLELYFGEITANLFILAIKIFSPHSEK